MPNQYSPRNKYKIDGQTLIVYTCNNDEILFDLEDMHLLKLNEYKWGKLSIGYAANGKLGYAHRLVMKAPKGLQIDHINRNKLDNRKSNLRLVNNQDNNWNKEAKGYYWAKHTSRWAATIAVDGKSHYLGYYNTEAEARAAYLEAKKKYHSTAPIRD